MTATGDDPRNGTEPGRGPGPGTTSGRASERLIGSVVAHVLSTATLLLPRGVSRTRYRQEFAAELYGQPPARQLGYVLSVCGHMGSLRAVVVHGSDGSRIPFLCRMNLHLWQRRESDEGLPFRTCSRCGREKGNLAGTSVNSLFLPMGAGRTKK